MKSSGTCGGFTAFTPPEPSPDARDGRPDGGHRCADAVVPPAGSGQLAAGRVGGARGAPRATPGDAPRLILAHAALVADRTSWSPPSYAECHSPTSIYRGLVGPTAQRGSSRDSAFAYKICWPPPPSRWASRRSWPSSTSRPAPPRHPCRCEALKESLGSGARVRAWAQPPGSS